MRGYFLAVLIGGLMAAGAVAAWACPFPAKIKPAQKTADGGVERMRANESAALSLLRKIPDAIHQFELFSESAATPSFAALREFDASLLPRALLPAAREDIVAAEGYLFRIYAEAPSGAWCIVSWPERYGQTGMRSFLICSGTDTVLQTGESFAGYDRIPSPEHVYEGGVFSGRLKSGWKKVE